MPKLDEWEEKFLNATIIDCITFNLKWEQAKVYIKRRFGREISEPTYYDRKKKLESEETFRLWLNNQTRMGYMLNHKMVLDDMMRLREYTLKRFFIESNQPEEKLNNELILKLTNDLRDTDRLISEFNIGTPILSQIFADSENWKKKYEKLAERIDAPEQPPITR